MKIFYDLQEKNNFIKNQFLTPDRDSQIKLDR